MNVLPDSFLVCSREVRRYFKVKIGAKLPLLYTFSYCSWACKIRHIFLSLLHSMQINNSRFNEVMWQYIKFRWLCKWHYNDVLYTCIIFKWMHYGVWISVNIHKLAHITCVLSWQQSQSVDETLGLTFTWHLEESANVRCPEPNHKNVSLLAS